MKKQRILIDAVEKLLALRKMTRWQKQTHPKCPPVCWFGDVNCDQDKVVTLGANPSRWEYFKQIRGVGFKRILLEPNQRRLYTLEKNETLENIIVDSGIRARIISRYNQYFETGKAYRWFGLDSNTPYNAEGFLRGFGASYYASQCRSAEFRAIHIDLFPFFTVKDFKEIRSSIEDDIKQNDWAQNQISALLKLIKPKHILIFGRTNYRCLRDFFQEKKFASNIPEMTNKHMTGELFGIKLFGISTNMGNPKGFNSRSLALFGERIRKRSRCANESFESRAQ